MAADSTMKNGAKSGAAGARPRPPVVVIVGHVDHGKTTLLDYIRKTNVAGREAGGITQAVGSYEIEHAPAGGGAARRITFIDTPGHEAFAAMRARGASIADLAVLVVAADEGVKPQTKEAVATIRATETPFIVALNKIDKVSGSAGLDKAKGDLAAAGVLLEGFGGQVSWHGVSAKTGEGVGDLLDLILLAADLENLTYDPAGAGRGFILEARRDPKRGIEATAIIKDGMLRRGEQIRTRTAGGKVKILENFKGERADELAPSAPAIVIGFEKLPEAGEEFVAGGGELREAVSAPAESGAGAGAKTGAGGSGAAGAAGSAAKPAGSAGALNLVLKASDAGSLEALGVVLDGIAPPDGKRLNIIEEGVGDVTDGDVKRAAASRAAVIGFKNKVEKGARVLAAARQVPVITSEIVYDLSKAVEDFLAGAAGPSATGELEVLAVFNQDKLDKQLVGGKVTKGAFRVKAPFEIMRAGEDGAPKAVGAGRIASLREKKTEIAQAEEGKEIGILASAQAPIQVGDKLVIKK